MASNDDNFSIDDIDCAWTLKASLLATIDAICCVPCCCGCGGCCGRFNPYILQLASDDDEYKQGVERCQLTCMTQMVAGLIVPCTCCLCCFGCCGLATPCARGVARCVMSVENEKKTIGNANSVHPMEQQMSR